MFFLSSCVAILQSLVTQDNIVTDDRIVGTWTGFDSKNIMVQKFMESKFRPSAAELDKHDYTKADSLFYTKSYIVSFSENNLNYKLIGGIAKINGEYYLNLKPIECLDNNDKEAYS